MIQVPSGAHLTRERIRPVEGHSLPVNAMLAVIRACRGCGLSQVLSWAMVKARIAYVLVVGLTLLALGARNAGAGSSVGVRSNAHSPRMQARSNPKQGVASEWYMWFDPAGLKRVEATWAYDWSWKLPASVRGLEWVPMVWGARAVTPGIIRSLRRDRDAHRARYLLAFNEPDFRHQANLTPAQVAALWPQLQQTGLILGAPAPAVWSDGWLARFMALAGARHLRVDFLALHFYPDWTNPGSVGELRRTLLRIHSRWHRPLWITELGTPDKTVWGAKLSFPATTIRAIGYMRRVVAMLDGLPFVQRYAWFTDKCWTDRSCIPTALFTHRGQLTALGRAYRTAH